MNKYGAQLKAHWERHLTSRYNELKDKESFFSKWGEEIEGRVDQLTETIAGDDPPLESYLSKMGRLGEARLTAESEVLREVLLTQES